MKSKHAKVLHRAGGLTLIEHVVRAASAITARRSHHGSDRTSGRACEAASGFHRVSGLSNRSEQKGTGHAVMACRGALQSAETAWWWCSTAIARCFLPHTLRELVDRQACGRLRRDVDHHSVWKIPPATAASCWGKTATWKRSSSKKPHPGTARDQTGQSWHLLLSSGPALEAHRRTSDRQSRA